MMNKTIISAVVSAAMLPIAALAFVDSAVQKDPVFGETIQIADNDLPNFNPAGFSLSSEQLKLTNEPIEVSDDGFAPIQAYSENTSVPIDDLLGSKTVMGHVYSTKNVVYGNTNVTKVDDTHICFNGFYYTDVNVTAEVNTATGAITIPGGQFLIEVDGIGKISLCKIDLTKGVYSTTDDIHGQFYETGVYFTDSYGFFVTEGASQGQYLTVGLMEYSAVASPNGSITNRFITYGGDGSMTAANQTVTPVTRDIYAYPIGADRIRLMLLPMHATNGLTGDILLNLGSDRTITIDPQIVYNYSIYGDFNFYGMTEKTDTSTGKITYSASILNPVTATYTESDGATIKWGSWMVASTSTGVYSASKGTELKLNSTVKFPSSITTDLNGDGTAENPYQITSATDFVSIAQRTLTDTSVRGSLKTNPYDNDDKYYEPFAGKYFTVTNDIDFSTLDVAYKPIGNKIYRFAGKIDGNGHSIKNLVVKNYAYDYCSLFGSLGADGELKNLVIDSPDISSLGYGIAGAVAYNTGLIDNVTVISPRIVATKGYNAGGISSHNYGTISNCNVENIYAYTLGYNGGITGRCIGGEITNCHATGSINFIGQQAFGGGIAGFVTKLTLSTPGAKISDCSFSGAISASNNEVGLGGIAGALAYSSAERCFANVVLANASPQSSYIGGLVGSVGEASFTDCYVTGWVRNTETAYAGGLAGHSSEYSNPVGTAFTNCYAAVMLSTKSIDPLKGLAGSSTNFTFTNCYYDSQLAAVTDDTYGRLTSQLTKADGLPGFSADVWTFEEGLYPRLKAHSESDAAAVSASTITLDDTDVVTNVSKDFQYKGTTDVEYKAVVNKTLQTDGGYSFTFDNGIGRLNYEQHTDTVFMTKNNVSKYVILNVAPVLFDGNGTADDPWIIATTDDFKKLAEITVKAAMPFTGKYFKLINDLDFGGETITAVCKDNSGKLLFGGTFDGNGHTIDNFRIQHVGYDDTGKYDPKSSVNCYYTGLFGNLGKTGVIKNLTVGSKAVVEGTSYVGGIVGGGLGLIENCRNYANVTAVTSYAGGIIGYIKKDTDKTDITRGRIKGCYNGGSIRANYNTAAGIVGWAVEAIVEECENTGSVTAYNFNASQKDGIQNTVGGIAGTSTSSTYTNVVNSGEISAHKTAGGLFGSITGTAALPSVVTNAVNYGLVTTWTDTSANGQIAGNNTLATFNNCYIDIQRQPMAAVANGAYDGVNAVPTATLTSGKVELPSEFWTLTSGTYPTLKYDNVPAQVSLNSNAVVLFADKESAKSISTEAALSSTVTWSLEDGSKGFTIADGKLTANPESELASAVLVAEKDGLYRKLPVSTFDIYILDGKGTEAAPFLIRTAADYARLAQTINTSGFDYNGYIFKVEADLDFKDMAFEPVGQNGSVFNGIFEGNGKKFKNVNYAPEANTDTYKGLFGTVGSFGVIRNVELAASSSISAYSFAGGIAAALYGKAENCVNRGTVTTTGTTNAGGIAAVAYPGSEFIDCVNYGNVTAKTNLAGGILGGSAANSKVLLTGCRNEGEVTGASKVGGIAASSSASVSDCVNKGNISATTTYAGGVIAEALLPSSLKDCSNEGKVSSPQYQGGVIATSVAHTTATPLVIDGCFNSADIEIGAKGYSGGVAGSLKAGVHISNCYNTGDIKTATGSAAIRVGGIAGDIASTVAAPSHIENSHNDGDIQAATLAAGICSYFSNAQNDGAWIRNSYNTGSITATATTASTSTAGIFGNGGSVIIEDCWNSGDITSNGGYIGGIVGQKNSYITSFSRNFNVGKITGNNAGVAGLIGYGRAAISECANYGDVTGTTNVAGLLGLAGPVAATMYTITINDSYNTGVLNATAANGVVGNIAVINASSTKYFECKNLYFNSDLGNTTTADTNLGNGAVSGVSATELCSLDISEGFTNYEATYPFITSHANNGHLAFACAQLVLDGDDTLDNVTKPFTIGTPDGAEWTATDNLKISGSIVTPACTVKGEKATLTLKAGGKTRDYELVLNSETSGISDILDDNVISRTYYGADGLQIQTPASGQIVIERTIYSDGNVKTTKRRMK